MPSAIAPPTSGPSATAIPVTALNRPIAAPRFSGGKRGGQQRQPQRQHQRRTGPLGCPGRDEEADAGRERGRRRGCGEQAQPDRVEGPAAVAVAERGGCDQQHREAQVVGVDRPLQVLDRGAQVEPDRAQRRRHHQRVEGRHQRADRSQGDHPGGRRLLACPSGFRAHLASAFPVVRRRNCRSMDRDPAKARNPSLDRTRTRRDSAGSRETIAWPKPAPRRWAAAGRGLRTTPEAGGSSR